MDMMALGLKRSREDVSSFMPSVGKFIAWCKEESMQQLGIKPVEQAYADFCKWHQNVHRKPQELDLVTWHTYQGMDSFALAHARIDDHRRMFAEAYKLTVEAVQRGEALNPHPPELEKIERQPMEQSEAIKQVESLKRLL